jgi:hypothetical protein
MGDSMKTIRSVRDIKKMKSKPIPEFDEGTRMFFGLWRFVLTAAGLMFAYAVIHYFYSNFLRGIAG